MNEWTKKCMNGQERGPNLCRKTFEIGKVSPVNYFIFVAVALGLLIALLTLEMSTPYGFFWHVVQWQLQSLLAIGLLVVTHIGLTRKLRFLRKKTIVQFVITGLVGGVLFSFPAVAIDIVFQNEPTAPTQSILFSSWVNELQAVILPVCITWVAINTPWILGFRLIDGPEDKSAMPARLIHSDLNARPPFAQLVDRHVWGDLLYLKSELQYLRVVTVKGQDLILYSLRDAISELSETSGVQVHRSYWVAYPSIQKFRSKGRQGMLVLADQTEIPVSRTHVHHVRLLTEDLGIKAELK